jgi:hypothetical protein
MLWEVGVAEARADHRVLVSSGITDVGGAMTFTYTAPNPATNERARTVVRFTDVVGPFPEDFRDTVGITLAVP